MEIKYDQFTRTWEIISQGNIVARSGKDQFKTQEEAAAWFQETTKAWLTGWDSKGVTLQ
jgi:hypothetical protein